MIKMRTLSRLSRAALAVAALGLVAACSQAPEGSTGPHDPYEPLNRKVHAFNKGLDRAFVKPSSEAYAAAVPGPARKGVSNFAGNLGEPLRLINHTLQGDVQEAGATFARFAFNTVFGLGGVLDPATEAGIHRRNTDFGETLAVWGVNQGAYLELPGIGPSTERDAVGMAVDLAMRPVYRLAGDSDFRYVAGGAQVLDVLNTRKEFAPVVDSLLYESADSYAAARIAYLQRRAAALAGGEPAEIELEDPFDFE